MTKDLAPRSVFREGGKFLRKERREQYAGENNREVLHMDFSRLEKNISDVIKEQQAKLGYMREKVRLYYPLNSLNHFFGTEADEDEMNRILEGFPVAVRDRLGEVKISNTGDRFCFLIPEQGAEYVRSVTGEHEFISELIELVRRHGCTIDQIRELFSRYSDKVYFEKVHNGEFDYLLRFEGDAADQYIYCFKEEGCHITYHRFLPEDYKELMA